MNTILIGSKVELTINGVKMEGFDSVTIAQDLCSCGSESDFGCHGVKNDEVYSEFYCKKCYNKKE